jgi:predicted secreted hydrolase
MRALVGLLVSFALLFAGDFRVALPGYKFEFPRDHFAHPDFQTEWWYYTGNLRTSQGRRFGFELTFFRHGLRRQAQQSSVWQAGELYLAHLAISDVQGKKFYHRRRLNRAGPGLAGASAAKRRIWHGNWQVEWSSDMSQQLQAVTDEFTLRLELVSQKPPVIHGRQGISRKGAGEGRASHYVSLTRLAASGVLQLGGQKHELTGIALMDHEFFTNQLAPDQVGWDWFSIQLENGEEVMLGRLRRKDGSTDPYSHGSYIERSGSVRHLESTDFTLTPGRTWRSPETGAMYPIYWSITVAPMALSLKASTPLPQQELVGRGRFSPTYWEGAMDYEGTLAGQPVRGVGYLEMTGYDQRMTFSQAQPR